MGLFIVNIHGDIEGDYEIIKQIPSADVREVVHCKNCRFYRQGTLNFNGRCVLHGGFDPDEEWFCADGEKENE